jgi:hypothetical protein
LAKTKDTFDAYRQTQKNLRIDFIAKALKILSNANYSNVTRLAKDVAKLVAEFEIKHYLSLAAGERAEEIKPISHVTLLRNQDYRKMLEAALNSDVENASNVSVITDLEASRIRISSLETQNFLLKEKIRNMDLVSSPGSGVSKIGGGLATFDEAEYFADLDLMLTLVDGMQEQAFGAFKTVLEGSESEGFPTAGFYGPHGLIVKISGLRQLSRVREKLKAWNAGKVE